MNTNEHKPLDFDFWNNRISYDGETGELRNKIRRGRGIRQQVGAIATTSSCGYLRVQEWIDGKLIGVQAHRLALLLYTKNDPGEFTINHLNHDRKDNRIDNLMLATRKEQNEDLAMNSRNTSGYTGVCWDKHNNKWKVQVGGKGIGHFDDLELAGFVAELTRDKLGYSKNHGRPLEDIQSRPIYE